jgi:peptide/nickel transport system ATP-binding protein
MAILSIRNLTTKLKIAQKEIAVVDNLSFDLNSGETLALVGESGSGKSMTALSIMRILPEPPALPPKGEITYQGQNILTLPERKMQKIRGNRIAMIFQNPSSALNPVYTIGDQLLEVANQHLHLYGEAATNKAVQALREVKVPSPESRMYEYPHQISGGMQQRVMIAMALMCEPDILIADEPTTALDVTIQAQVLDLMRKLQQEKGTAILLITHDMGVVAEMAHNVIVMYATQEVESGSSNDIFNNMKHPYTTGLFNSRPQINNDILTPIKGSVPSPQELPSGCYFHPRCPQCSPQCSLDRIKMNDHNGHKTRCILFDE